MGMLSIPFPEEAATAFLLRTRGTKPSVFPLQHFLSWSACLSTDVFRLHNKTVNVRREQGNDLFLVLCVIIDGIKKIRGAVKFQCKLLCNSMQGCFWITTLRKQPRRSFPNTLFGITCQNCSPYHGNRLVTLIIVTDRLLVKRRCKFFPQFCGESIPTD